MLGNCIPNCSHAYRYFLKYFKWGSGRSEQTNRQTDRQIKAFGVVVAMAGWTQVHFKYLKYFKWASGRGGDMVRQVDKVGW